MTVFDTLLAPVMPILQQIEAGRKKHHKTQAYKPILNKTNGKTDFINALQTGKP